MRLYFLPKLLYSAWLLYCLENWIYAMCIFLFGLNPVYFYYRTKLINKFPSEDFSKPNFINSYRTVWSCIYTVCLYITYFYTIKLYL